MSYIDNLPLDDEYDIIKKLDYDGNELFIVQNNGKYSDGHKRYKFKFYDYGYTNSWVLIPLSEMEYKELLSKNFNKEDTLKIMAFNEGARIYNSVGFINKQVDSKKNQL